MTFSQETPHMNFITGFLKGVFVVLIILVSFGLIGSSILIWPDPDAAVLAGAGVICLLMIWATSVIHPAIPSWP